jgi:hypothetical protein
MLWALGNFSRFIRPGFERIEVKTSVGNSEKFFASGFQDPKSKEIVLVLINSNSGSVRISLESYFERNTTLKGYLTNEISNLELFEIDLENLQLPAESIVTLVLPSK